MEVKVPLGNWFNHFLETIRAEINQRMRDCALDSAGFTILYYMSMYGDGQTAAELTRMLILDKAAISRTVTELASAGYLRRETDEQDSRKQHLLLTDSGRELLERVTQVYDDIFHRMTVDIPKEEVYACLDTLAKIHDNTLKMREATFAPAARKSDCPKPAP